MVVLNDDQWQTLHIPVNRLAGSTWGTSPLQPLTRILDLKGNIEVIYILQVQR